MGEFLGIILSISFFITPKGIDRVQVWPYAVDTNSHLRELSLTFQKTKDGWCPDFSETNQTACVVITNGRWVDGSGRALLDIKSNLKSTHGTNYVFKPKDWDNPLEFSVRNGKDERTFEITEKGKTIRELRVKMSKSNKSDH